MTDAASAFLARFENYTFAPHESVLLEEAAFVVSVLAGLKDADEIDIREIRLQQDHLRKLIGALDWPVEDDMTDEQRRSWAGRNLARQRWN